MSGQSGTESIVNARRSAALWQPQAALAAAALEHDLAALLTATGSLTASLQATAGADFSVQVLRQKTCNLFEFSDHSLSACADDRGLLREVYLCCHGMITVFAQTLIPDATLEQHPWLGDLGDQPLGQRLFARADVVRQPFEFARLTTDDELTRSALAGMPGDAAAPGQLWARRSLFLIASAPVSVNEVFFPATLARIA